MSTDALSLVLSAKPGRTLRVWAPLAALSVHAAVAFLLPRRVAAEREHLQMTTEVMDIEPPPPSPPPAPDTPPPEPPAQEHAIAPSVTPRAAAAPAPAAAAAVLTQKETPGAPVDFTDTFVVGTAQTYAGGVSAADGTTKRYVEVAGTAPAGSGRAPPPQPPSKPDVDRSRKAHLAEGGTWSCPFPTEADAEQLDHAVVTLRIDVGPNGQATRVAVVSDPGHGFGREARTCALAKRYQAALSSSGVAEAGTLLVNVRFDR